MIKHVDSTQQAKSTTIVPLISNEGPYINNIVRSAKNIYTYADRVNDILSCGGCVSRLRAATTEVLGLYRLVKILDGEVITSVSSYVNKTERFGLVVSEPDEFGYYLVCTFCPNFIFPPDIKVFDKTCDIGVLLKVDITNYLTNVCNIDLSNNQVSETIVGKVTGEHSIFFCGTMRLFSIFTGVTGLDEAGFNYETEALFTPTGIIEIGYNTSSFFITIQPQPYSGHWGDVNIPFSVTVQGGVAPYTYAWYLNGNQVQKMTVPDTTDTLYGGAPCGSVGVYDGDVLYVKITDSNNDMLTSQSVSITLLPAT